ncbi:MAG: DUF3237 domain-containing protein [Pseudomonadota bacterium]
MTTESTPFLILEVTVGPPVTLGDSGMGVRRLIPITGGTFAGELSGKVLGGGADWQYVLPDGTIELSAHYALETDDGVRIEVNSDGLRSGPPEVLEALARGEARDASEYYFRTAMRFHTGHERLRSLNHILAVARGARAPGGVRLEVYRVL